MSNILRTKVYLKIIISYSHFYFLITSKRIEIKQLTPWNSSVFHGNFEKFG